MESPIDLSWLRNEDGSINWDMSYVDGEDWCANDDMAYPMSGDFDKTAYYTESINAWAQKSARGAARKELIDRYQIPYYLGDYITKVSEQYGKFDYTITLPAGINASEVDGIVSTVDFILNIGGRFDGVSQYISWVWNTGEDGILTVHIMAGGGRRTTAPIRPTVGNGSMAIMTA